MAELPPVINAGDAVIQDRPEGRSRMVKEGTYRADWTIRSKTIYSFQPLDQEPLSSFIDGAVRSIPTAEWTQSADRSVERALVHLLNNTLQEQLYADLDWHGDRGYFFFRAPENLTPKKIYSASRVGRTVFRGYYPRKDDPSRFSFYRHAALRRQWHRLDEMWVLEINPTYHFTFDGRRESKYASEYLSEIKRKEGHAAVRSDLFAWAKYLQSSAGRLKGAPAIVFGRLLDLTVQAGLHDELWRKPKGDHPESVAPDPGRLF